MRRLHVNTSVGLCLSAALLLATAAAVLGTAQGAQAKPAHHAPKRRCKRTKHHRCPAPKHRSSASRIQAPAAHTGPARSVLGSTATITGSVNPKGRPTTYWIQYGRSNAYGARTQSARAGRGTRLVPVSATVGGLAPLAVYHFRLVASNCGGCRGGTAYGTDATVTLGGYVNPVWGAAEAADPFVLDNGGQHRDYWAFVTGNLFPILHSSDLVHWHPAGTALRTMPSWVIQQGDWHPWAPSVVQAPHACPGTSSASCYIMYYVGVSARTNANCVAVATATRPGGPYTDQGPLTNGGEDAAGRPVGCGDNQGFGLIDPSPFVDPVSGRPYLYVSEDFSCPAGSGYCTRRNATLQPTISVIPLRGDFLGAAGPRTPLFSGASNTWEGAGVAVPTVEGPFGLFHNGTYYVLYSGGNWRSTYGEGFATASSPTGPFTKGSQIMTGNPLVLGPGGGDQPVIGPHGGTWLLYHGRAGSDANPRTLRLDPFGWQPGSPQVPVIGGPTTTPQLTSP